MLLAGLTLSEAVEMQVVRIGDLDLWRNDNSIAVAELQRQQSTVDHTVEGLQGSIEPNDKRVTKLELDQCLTVADLLDWQHEHTVTMTKTIGPAILGGPSYSPPPRYVE